MKPTAIDDIFSWAQGQKSITNSDIFINNISIDSRKISNGEFSLFFALKGTLVDGHHYLLDCIAKGVKSFVIDDPTCIDQVKTFNYILVDDAVDALQQIATAYRKHFKPICIGITGSNGKTTIKEWLSHFLAEQYNVVKSPSSYNSQIGVALSMFEIEDRHDLALFEAGISKKGEMSRLEEIIKPDIGLISNIGTAHAEGFSNQMEKIKEKLTLFNNTKKIVCCHDHVEILNELQRIFPDKELITWGKRGNLVKIINIDRRQVFTNITFEYGHKESSVQVKVTDLGSIENLLHCLATMLVLGIDIDTASQKLNGIFPISNRMEMINGFNNSLIINDTYNHDLASLENAFDWIHIQKGIRKSLAIISDFVENKTTDNDVAGKIEDLKTNYEIDEIWWLGEQYKGDKNFSTKEDLIAAIKAKEYQGEVILIKGANKYKLDDLKAYITANNHSAKLSIDLNALDQNLRSYAELLAPTTGIIAILKAEAYGTGSAEVARMLQYRGVKYIAVAFVEEGIVLRESGIHLPIIILNPDISQFYNLHKYALQPEIYSLEILKAFAEYCIHHELSIPIHLKLDTGMNRLGLKQEDLKDATDIINNYNLHLETVFSHLAGSENKEEDSFTTQQFDTFIQMCNYVEKYTSQIPLKHILNTSGIARFPSYHLDLVRLGLGLYGIDTTDMMKNTLEKVHQLVAKIIQIKKAKKGETVGYNQKGQLSRDSILGIINIGYADGLPRNCGNGRYAVNVNGNLAPIIGNVCMDLTIIDLTDCSSYQIGDEVEIYGKIMSIENLSKVSDTIPYEILSRTSSRVRREFLK